MEGRDWIAALTGLLFFVLAIVSFAVGGEPPDPTEEPIREVVAFYADNETSLAVGLILAGLAATALVVFTGYLRGVLDGPAPRAGRASLVMFGGSVIYATGVAIDATLTIALIEATDPPKPVAVEALSILWNNDFVPFAVGGQLFLVGFAAAVLRHGALPKWLGWVAIVLAVIAVTPIGFVAFIAHGILMAVLSVMLVLRERRGARPAPAA